MDNENKEFDNTDINEYFFEDVKLNENDLQGFEDLKKIDKYEIPEYVQSNNIDVPATRGVIISNVYKYENFKATCNRVAKTQEDFDPHTQDYFVLSKVEIQNIQENSYSMIIEIDQCLYKIYATSLSNSRGLLNKMLRVKRSEESQLETYETRIGNGQLTALDFASEIIQIVLKYCKTVNFDYETFIAACLRYHIRLYPSTTPAEVYGLRLLTMFTTYLPQLKLFTFHAFKQYLPASLIYTEMFTKCGYEDAQILFNKWQELATLVSNLDLHKALTLVFYSVIKITKNCPISNYLSVFEIPLNVCVKVYKIDEIVNKIVQFAEESAHYNLFNYDDNYVEDVYNLIQEIPSNGANNGIKLFLDMQ